MRKNGINQALSPKNFKFSKMKKAYLYFVFLLLLISCAEWDKDGVDFRNYLRDRHPYCELTEIDLNTLFAYQINDTINNQIWIYTAQRSKHSVRCVCVKK